MIKSGDRFGKLVAISFSHRDAKYRHHWLFKCDCGNNKVISIANVKQYPSFKNSTTSCGCIAKARILAIGEASFNNLFSKYKRISKIKNLEFLLSKEEFRKLTQSNCSYCGANPQQIIKQTRANGEYLYNGIDRIDSSKGYTIQNCISCCGICNKMKLDHDIEFFYNHINKIIQQRKSK